jgi:hypothetical protein
MICRLDVFRIPLSQSLQIATDRIIVHRDELQNGAQSGTRFTSHVNLLNKEGRATRPAFNQSFAGG